MFHAREYVSISAGHVLLRLEWDGRCPLVYAAPVCCNPWVKLVLQTCLDNRIEGLAVTVRRQLSGLSSTAVGICNASGARWKIGASTT